ncbi:unnamed protein product [Caenorhabditis auriculariae]|uniref:Protein kinase domain-containing protein n=1 Tax=Caenorhabditis auriculariae TaxID=2777116 RepID=A0A8S1HL96_9PELO|nr:unnamed protein product [Caenorhabditis auriculariae]
MVYHGQRRRRSANRTDPVGLNWCDRVEEAGRLCEVGGNGFSGSKTRIVEHVSELERLANTVHSNPTWRLLLRPRQKLQMEPRYEVWKGNGETILYAPYKYENIYFFEGQLDDITMHTFFSRHWFKSVYLAIAYVIVTNVLQRFMENRKPLNIRPLLILWNGSLAVFSILGTWRFGTEFFHLIFNRPWPDSICFSVDPYQPAAFWACMFAFSKIAEFGDTMFLVLRKRPVIFLHWYHHAVVLVLSWHSAVELTAAGRWFIFMNYLVHSIMYTYYAVTSIGYRLPKLISMTVTALQTTQMLIGVAISVIVLYLKLNGQLCQQSYDNLAICFAIYTSFLVLFSNFFNKAYLVRRPKPSSKLYADELELFGGSLDIESSIGRGGFSDIYGAVYDNLHVAMKVPRAHNCEISKFHEVLQELQREASIMAALEHRNVVKFHGICYDRVHPVMSAISAGSSLGQITRKLLLLEESAVVPLRVAYSWCRQVTAAMEFISHTHVHGDLKADNVLVKEEVCFCFLSLDSHTEDCPDDFSLWTEPVCPLCQKCSLAFLTLKICDFGTAFPASRAGETRKEISGTESFMAPEVKNEKKCSEKSDVYAYGCMVMEIDKVCQKLESLSPTFSLPSSDDLKFLPLGSVEVVKSCLKNEPHERPSFSQLHRFFTNGSVTSNVEKIEAEDLDLNKRTGSLKATDKTSSGTQKFENGSREKQEHYWTLQGQIHEVATKHTPFKIKKSSE